MASYTLPGIVNGLSKSAFVYISSTLFILHAILTPVSLRTRVTLVIRLILAFLPQHKLLNTTQIHICYHFFAIFHFFSHYFAPILCFAMLHLLRDSWWYILPRSAARSSSIYIFTPQATRSLPTHPQQPSLHLQHDPIFYTSPPPPGLPTLVPNKDKDHHAMAMVRQIASEPGQR